MGVRPVAGLEWVRVGVCAAGRRPPPVGLRPMVDFGVAINETEPAGTVMVGGGDVHPTRRRSGIEQEEAIVDGIRVFIDEQPEGGRRWMAEIGFAGVGVRAGVGGIEAFVAVGDGDGADEAIHGNATNPCEAPAGF